MGLLVHLQPRYRVWSNREAGYGRADILVVPQQPGLPGAVLELKRLWEEETPAAALDDAMTQLKDRDYAAVLREAGAAPRQAWAVVFDGKRLHVRHAAV